MTLRNLIVFGLAASALLNLFSVGLKTSPRDATYLFRRPGELVRALLAMNVLMPLFVIALISMFPFHSGREDCAGRAVALANPSSGSRQRKEVRRR